MAESKCKKAIRMDWNEELRSVKKLMILMEITVDSLIYRTK